MPGASWGHLLAVELSPSHRMCSKAQLVDELLRILASPRQGKALFAGIMARVDAGPYTPELKAGVRALIDAMRKGRSVA